MIGTMMLAIITISNLTPCSAIPLHMPRESTLTTRAGIWRPTAGTTWDYQLTGSLAIDSTNVDVWDIDLFDANPSTIDSIHAKGKHVICYFSAGSIEDWRPDVSKFQSSDKGNAVQGWQGENWLQIKSKNVRDIMLARLDLAAQKKCDGVEPDNVDGYDNGNGLGLTGNDAVDYVSFLADAAHSRNMAVGLKNAGSIVSRLVSKVEFSVQEECVQYGNCAEFKPFIDQNKPVFHVEYSSGGVSKRHNRWNDHNSDDPNDSYDSPNSDNLNLPTPTTRASTKTAVPTPTTAVPATTTAAPTATSRAISSASSSSSSATYAAPSATQVASSNKAGSASGGSAGCSASVPGFSSIRKNLDLGAWVQLCN
jgi:hypothetical protein